MLSTQQLRDLGQMLQELIDSGTPRKEAMEAWVAAAYKTFSKEHAAAIPTLPSAALAWRESAFARVEVEAKLAASMLCTNAEPETLVDLELPWRSFAIQVPDGLLGDVGQQGVPSFLLVTQGAVNKKIIILEFGRRHFAFSSNSALGELSKLEYKPSENINQALADKLSPEALLEFDTFGRRIGSLVGKLVVGVCIEFAEPRLREVIRATQNQPVRMRKRQAQSQVVHLYRPVVLDVRKEVKEYARGTGKKPTVRTLVCGHYRMQRYGTNLEHSRRQHIEPHWRNLKAEKVADRPHILK